MASAARHLKQAMHNKQFAEELLNADPVEYPDWAVTAVFYAALHYVNHFFVRTTGWAPDNHLLRSTSLNRCAETRAIRFAYETLRNRCDECRYLCMAIAPREVEELLKNQLGEIKRAMAT